LNNSHFVHAALCQAWFAELMIEGDLVGESTGPTNGVPSEKVGWFLLFRL